MRGNESTTVNRIDLLVPAHLVAGLRIPALAITDGTADPDWVEVSLSRLRYRRQPSQLVPMDSRSAGRVRRYARLEPWALVAQLVGLSAWSIVAFGDLSGAARTVTPALACGTWLLSMLALRGLPRDLPFRTRDGDLRIPQVPIEVAHQWVGQNPGVIATAEPAPRRHSRRFYARWAIGLPVAAAVLAVVLANDRREDPILLWMLLPAFLLTGIVMLVKTLPLARPGAVRTWPPGAL